MTIRELENTLYISARYTSDILDCFPLEDELIYAPSEYEFYNSRDDLADQLADIGRDYLRMAGVMRTLTYEEVHEDTDEDFEDD